MTTLFKSMSGQQPTLFSDEEVALLKISLKKKKSDISDAQITLAIAKIATLKKETDKFGTQTEVDNVVSAYWSDVEKHLKTVEYGKYALYGVGVAILVGGGYLAYRYASNRRQS